MHGALVAYHIMQGLWSKNTQFLALTQIFVNLFYCQSTFYKLFSSPYVLSGIPV